MSHFIADVSFRAGLVTCSCDARITAETPYLLASEYQAHRQASGEKRGNPADIGYPRHGPGIRLGRRARSS